MVEGLMQPMRLIVISAIVHILFGPGRLPELGEGLGKSIMAFKKALKDENNDFVLDHNGHMKSGSTDVKQAL